MNCMWIMLAASVPGVDYGWQPTSDGQLEYIIQIEPELLQLLADGDEITNVIHPDVDGVKRFRVRVGNSSLPRLGATPAPAEDTTALDPPDFPTGGEFVIPREPIPPADDESEDPANFAEIPDAPPMLDPPVFPAEPPPAEEFQDPPAALPPDLSSEPIFHRQAGYSEAPAENPPAKSTGVKQSTEAVPSETKPWLPLVFTALVLFASIGLNAYLGWIAVGISQRYRRALQQLRDVPTEAAEGLG